MVKIEFQKWKEENLERLNKEYWENTEKEREEYIKREFEEEYF